MIYCEILVIFMALCSLITAIVVGWWIVLLDSKWLKILVAVACVGVFCSGYIRLIVGWRMVWEGNKTRSQNSILAEPGDYFFQQVWQNKEGLLFQIERSPLFAVGVFSILAVFVLIIIISMKFTKSIKVIRK